MNTKQSFQEEYHYKSAYADRENLCSLAHAALLLARAVFFQEFSPGDKETMQVHRQLVRRLSGTNAPFDTYLSCCMELLAAGLRPECEVRINAVNIEQLLTGANTLDLSSRKDAASGLRQNKRVVWTGLAEAVLDVVEDSPLNHVEYWIPWFRQRRARAELALFMRVMEFQTFKNRAHENE